MDWPEESGFDSRQGQKIFLLPNEYTEGGSHLCLVQRLQMYGVSTSPDIYMVQCLIKHR
jgi:hypothetical protein